MREQKSTLIKKKKKKNTRDSCTQVHTGASLTEPKVEFTNKHQEPVCRWNDQQGLRELSLWLGKHSCWDTTYPGSPRKTGAEG